MADPNATIVQPQPPAESAPAPTSNPDRYELLDELARGGMGVVYRARDRVLNRVVGLKTLISPEAPESAVQRFRAEAHITGQLQHPNIPPVHDLGTLPDGRPFLAMKLIKGDTLDVLLKARPDPAHDRGRFVAVFEHIAQGVAYAHAHNVIHRDLKPLNVMVGAFGEVQVMDWGLAKVLGAPQPSERTDADAPAPTLVTAPTDDSDRTRAGSVMGTPAYMPREQAIGAIDQLDARSDVFSLGGILCTILTGKPPYVGDSAETTRQLAAVAKLDDAFARLNSCGAEPALVDLCKWCLQAESKDRPKNADVVVVAVAVLRAEAERRARQAELDRVRAEGEREAAEAHTLALRKQRQLQLAILCGVLVFVAAGTSFALYRHDVRTAQERADNELVLLRMGDQNRQENVQRDIRASLTANLNLATNLRKQHNFKGAEAALAQASTVAMKVGIKGMQQAKREVVQAQRELTFVVKLDQIRYRKWLWVLEAGRGGTVTPWLAASEYRAAFAAFDLDLIALAPDVAAWRIAESGVKTEIIAAVDDWALYEGFSAHNEHLLDIVRRADPGGWLDRLRDPKVRTDVTAVTRLANDADVQLLSPTALSTLAELMNRNGLDPSPVLRRARVAHPSEFELAFALGQWHRGHARYQQIAQYEAACALRPDNTTVWMQLADALKTWGDDEGAIAAYRKIIELEPKYAHAHTNLGNFHFQKKNYADCILCAKNAISADPKRSNGYALLGRALQATGDISGARVALTEAARLDATWAEMLAQLPPVPLAPPPRPK